MAEVLAQVHELKCQPPYFEGVVSGTKNFELRLNDRDFHIGDAIRLREWLPDTPENTAKVEYTGRELNLTVTYLLKDYPGIEPGYCILGTRIKPRATAEVSPLDILRQCEANAANYAAILVITGRPVENGSIQWFGLGTRDQYNEMLSTVWARMGFAGWQQYPWFWLLGGVILGYAIGTRFIG